MEEKLLALLERLAQAERALLAKEAYRLGLSATQAQLLVHLAQRPQGVVALAELLALTPATVSEALAALERKGLLERAQDPQDGRRFLLRATEKGQKTAQTLKGYASPLRRALAEVDGEALLLPLMGLLAGLVRQGVVGETGMCLTCRHLRREKGLFCSLLGLPLKPFDLRLACPDHQAT
ncbi:MAG: winged helix DNA-binding protein [Thermus sp.]|uniref:MarR family winged helix-turn-helix transcriptional regulator n=1 Tax=Thermus sp. TaxID=275 RepID=UPI0025D2494C|nr:winged helix DNA-binding protein [Thermus sp.]MCS6869780.1 winged helix DNA-binding protein [Thermus sp.]MDW8016234.1 winged helix DNA-binding protein [Thermus sp.]MDW8358922.1 winged helix DNA-binding protein [Thermus sp.]